MIRPISFENVSAAADLLSESSLSPGAEDSTNVDAYWRGVEACRQQGGDVVVYIDDDEVVGVLQMMVLHHFQHQGGIAVELESFHVRSDRRSQGIGAAMLAVAEEFARSIGAYRVQLTSNQVRKDAHRFYLREGYELTHAGFRKQLNH
jgi:GNAT superfamily N-acetyltransferase